MTGRSEFIRILHREVYPDLINANDSMDAATMDEVMREPLFRGEIGEVICGFSSTVTNAAPIDVYARHRRFEWAGAATIKALFPWIR